MLVLFYCDGENIFDGCMDVLPRRNEVVVYNFTPHQPDIYSDEALQQGMKLNGTKWRVKLVIHHLTKKEAMESTVHRVSVEVEPLEK